VSNLVIEFPGLDQNEEAITRKVDLDWFDRAVGEARKNLIGDERQRLNMALDLKE
jgi:hypothetical protein